MKSFYNLLIFIGTIYLLFSCTYDKKEDFIDKPETDLDKTCLFTVLDKYTKMPIAGCSVFRGDSWNGSGCLSFFFLTKTDLNGQILIKKENYPQFERVFYNYYFILENYCVSDLYTLKSYNEENKSRNITVLLDKNSILKLRISRKNKQINKFSYSIYVIYDFQRLSCGVLETKSIKKDYLVFENDSSFYIRKYPVRSNSSIVFKGDSSFNKEIIINTHSGDTSYLPIELY